MKFNEAYTKMRNGYKISLPEWRGYWVWDNNTIMIHCENGDVMDIRNTDDVSYTFGFICREDWIIYSERKIDDNDVDCLQDLNSSESLSSKYLGKSIIREFTSKIQKNIDNIDGVKFKSLGFIKNTTNDSCIGIGVCVFYNVDDDPDPLYTEMRFCTDIYEDHMSSTTREYLETQITILMDLIFDDIIRYRAGEYVIQMRN